MNGAARAVRTIGRLFLNEFSQEVGFFDSLTHEESLFDFNQDQIANLFLNLYKNKSNEYFRFYNQDRKHQSLNYETPATWYKRGLATEKSTNLTDTGIILN